LELDHLAGQVVDAARYGGSSAEELILDFVDVVLQPCHDGAVLVDHLVQDGVQHRLWTKAQQCGVLLKSAANPGQVR
jgi:hypothetical protein